MPLPPLDSRNDADAHHRRPNAGAVVGVARQDAEPAVSGHEYRVHIRLMSHGSLRVSPLRRVPFVKQPSVGPPQKEPKRPCPSVRPSLRSGSLAPVPLRGHAVTGHPWPNTALPASMPGGPLRRTSSQPPEGASRSRSKADQKQIKSRSKTTL